MNVKAAALAKVALEENNKATESNSESDALKTAPPVLIDLDGDGKISMMAAESSTAYYDFTGDGFAHKSGEQALAN